VDHYQVATPLTFAHFIKSEHGAFYGLDHGMKRFEPKTFFLRLRPEVPEVPGLYLTGQDIVTIGFECALLGGVLCASKVLGVFNPKAFVKRSKEKTKGKDAHHEKKEPAVEQPVAQAPPEAAPPKAVPQELIEMSA
jgi:hypothetical protein